MKKTRQEIQEFVKGPVAIAKMASIKRQLEDFRQAEAFRIAIAASSSSASVPQPPPEPLPSPASEPEENDDEFEADFGAAAEASSVYSEYENDVGNLDDDMSTVAPSDAMATRDRTVYLQFFALAGACQWMTSRVLHEEALRRHSVHIVAANEETRRRMWDTEDRWLEHKQRLRRRLWHYQVRLSVSNTEFL